MKGCGHVSRCGQPGLGDRWVDAWSLSLPFGSRVRGVAVGVASGDGSLLHEGCCWVESVGVVFLWAKPSRMKRDTAF